MAVTNWKYPGTCVNADRGGKEAWNSPGNAASSNDEWAGTGSLYIEYTDWLRCTNFGFTTGDIPSGATINGIEVEVERHSQFASSIYDSSLRLRKSTGQVGDDKASGSYWPTSDANAAYGGASDTWNSGLTDSDIRSTGFGVDLSAYIAVSMGTAFVDTIRVRVYYTTETPYESQKQAFAGGAVAQASSKQAFAGGALSEASNKPAFTQGAEGETSSKPAFAHGLGEEQATKPAFAGGAVSEASSKPAFTQGIEGETSGKPAFAHGVGAGQATKPAFAGGSLSEASSKPAFTQAAASSQTGKPAFVQGVHTESQTKQAFAAGAEASTTTKQAFCEGLPGSYGTVAAFTCGAPATYTKPVIDLRALDSSGNILCFIDDHVDLEWELQEFSLGWIRFKLHMNSPHLSYISEDGRVVLSRHKVDLLYTHIVRLERAYDEQGKATEYMDVTCEAYSRMLKMKHKHGRTIIPPAGSEFRQITDKADDAIKQMLRYNAISGYVVDTDRVITNLEVAPDHNAAADTVTMKGRYQDLFEYLGAYAEAHAVEWAITGALVPTGGSKYYFETYYPRRGKDKTHDNSDGNPPVVFVRGRDFIAGSQWWKDYTELASVIYMLGDGEGTDQVIHEVEDTGRVSAYGRREFVSTINMQETTDLSEEANQLFAQEGEGEGVTIDFVESAALMFMRDFIVGDLVTVRDDEWNLDWDRKVTAVRGSYNPEGGAETLEVEIGDPSATLFQAIDDLEKAQRKGGGARPRAADDDGLVCYIIPDNPLSPQAGTSGKRARVDHKHAALAGPAVALGDTGGSASYHEGTGEQFSRVDHVHGAFDDLDPEPVGAYASPGTAYVAARRDHVHAGALAGHTHNVTSGETGTGGGHNHGLVSGATDSDSHTHTLNSGGTGGASVTHSHPKGTLTVGDESAHTHPTYMSDGFYTGYEGLCHDHDGGGTTAGPNGTEFEGHTHDFTIIHDLTWGHQHQYTHIASSGAYVGTGAGTTHSHGLSGSTGGDTPDHSHSITSLSLASDQHSHGLASLSLVAASNHVHGPGTLATGGPV